MVRKLTAWKTIAVKDATYAVATKNSLKKNIYRRLRKCDHDGKLSNAKFSGGTKTCHEKIFHYHFKRL